MSDLTMPAARGDVERLPKWAQAYIEQLEMRLREAHRRTGEALAAAGFVDEARHSTPGLVHRPSRLDQLVVFGEGERPPYEVRYGTRDRLTDEREGLLTVRAYDGTLAVLPSGSNSVLIRREQR